MSEINTPRPVQAAVASAATFSVGAAAPLALVLMAPLSWLLPAVAMALTFLAILGVLGARVGGAEVLKPTLRVTFWGAFAMALTAGIGALIGKTV